MALQPSPVAATVSPKLLAAARSRIKQLEKAVKDVQREIHRATGGVVTSTNPVERDAYYNEQVAWNRVREIYWNEQSAFTALLSEGQAGQPSPGVHAMFAALRLDEYETRLQKSRADALERAVASKTVHSNTRVRQALERELVALERAFLALERERSSLDMILASVGRQSVEEIQRRRDDELRARQEIDRRLREKYDAEARLGGAIIGGLLMLHFAGNAVSNAANEDDCLKSGGAYVRPLNPASRVGFCRYR